MKTFTLCAATVLALTLAGCSQTAPDTREADAKAVKDTEAQWNQDFASKDVEKLAAHYADNAVLMSSGAPASSGKDAIRKALTQMVADPALTLKFQASRVEVGKASDIAYTQGSYTMTVTDPFSKKVINDHGSYVTTYGKQPDGSWKALADIATSEVPPSTEPPPAPKLKSNFPRKGKIRESLYWRDATTFVRALDPAGSFYRRASNRLWAAHAHPRRTSRQRAYRRGAGRSDHHGHRRQDNIDFLDSVHTGPTGRS